MSYEVTATKERPRDFSTLAGQEFVVSTLKNAIDSKRIAHAYLFSGPRGVGKTSSARILARALNCENGPTATPCGHCTHCQEIQQGNCMDVIEIDGASNTSVNDIRAIKDEVQFAPNSCRYKIYIIDEVHMLSNSAFNALLKTIEEPPEYIIFIFATTEIHKVPATIRSRCQQFNFRLIPTETIQSLLAKISESNGIKAEEEALFWIAKEATGSLRDAYTLYDQVVAFSNNEITLEKIREKLGLVGLDQINELVGFAVNKKRDEALLSLDNILTMGISAEQFIIDLTEYFRSILFIKSGIKRETLLGYKPERFNQEVIEKLSMTQIEAAIDYLLNLYRNIRFSLSQRFELELLISKLCELTSYFSHRELLQLIRHIKGELANGISNGTASAAPKMVSTTATTSSFSTPSVKATPAAPEAAPFTPSVASSAKPMAEPTLQSEKPAEPITIPTPPIRSEKEVNPLTVQPSAASEQFNALDSKQKVEALMKTINKSRDLALYNSLSHVLDWVFDSNSLTLVVNEMYHQDMILQYKEELMKFTSQLCGRPIAIKVDYIEKKEETNEDDEEVRQLLNIFPGHLVD